MSKFSIATLLNLANIEGQDLEVLLAQARAVRDEHWGCAHHLLAQGLYPTHQYVPRYLWLLHLRSTPRFS